MPKFVIERQYLLPIYQRLIIDAPDITTACQEAVEDDDWESAEEDGDGSGATTINAAREIPQGLLEQIEPAISISAASSGKTSPDTDRALRSRRNLPTTNSTPVPPRQQLRRARGVGAVRPSGSCWEPEQEQTCGPRYGLRRSSVTRKGLIFG